MNDLSIQARITEAVSAEQFRNGMRNLAGAVNIITTAKGDLSAGLTATAVMSISAEPARVMVCINKDVYAHSLIEEGGSICINTLSADQIEQAQVFAGMRKDIAAADRFNVGAWNHAADKAPVLEGALLNLECKVSEIIPASSHSMIICDVLDIHYCEQADKSALIYFDCNFANLQPSIN
jgi:flavin reductase (DIM6/NTAB) family NADH-FMN oxidoreductase RutF